MLIVFCALHFLFTIPIFTTNLTKFRMRLNPIIYCLLCLAFINCNTEPKSNVATSSAEEKLSRVITKKDIESIKYADFGLSNDAKQVVDDWQKYQELTIQIDFLKTADLTFFKSDKTLLNTFLNDLIKEMPKRITTNEVLARIKALETKLLRLNSLLKLDNITKQEQLNAIKEFLVTVSNLNLQINKKFEFDANNISKPN